MTFLVGFDFTTTIKLTLIRVNFHCMLSLAAATHSLITEIVWKF